MNPSELPAIWKRDDDDAARQFPEARAEDLARWHQRKAEARLLWELHRNRAWSFWGPFWAIFLNGAIGALLYVFVLSR